ncbi:GH32 C-terminal domain-containing protein [Streptomyces coeruleorubidus]|uniref:GH32 C-terminal domain-containing protein n=1 Tax=Streptomyces coeruleorubidus TaxID=116188 RepID=UPI0033DE2216
MWPSTGRRLPSEGPNAILRILLDHSVAEVFTASGRTLTLRVYPVGDGPWRVQMGATGVASAAYTVGAWDLTPPEPLVGDTATRAAGHIGWSETHRPGRHGWRADRVDGAGGRGLR